MNEWLVIGLVLLAVLPVYILIIRRLTAPIEIRKKDLCEHYWLKSECPYCPRKK